MYYLPVARSREEAPHPYPTPAPLLFFHLADSSADMRPVTAALEVSTITV